MKTDDLRDCYLDFFESKGCLRRQSDVLCPHDPTVLFTPAGMNQFKQEFLGLGRPDFTKATTCQKCIRTGDITNVGVTAYHHTFFEMLGNFSFGDYFKKEAIHWAWEFLTSKKYLGLKPDLITITVYLDDDEAFDIWHREVGVPANRISRLDEYENFWPAGSPTDGPDGVCGPCSEIYYHTPGAPKSVEIWNLVFTQFNRKGAPPNNLIPLPKKNIDTGMGLERTASVLQGVASNFEIDSLRPLCDVAGEVLGRRYEFAGDAGRAMRRIADHVRAVTNCIHEGVLPGNEKQNYIVRQLLRRASLEGYLLGCEQPFLFHLVPKVVELLSRPYPELAQTATTVAEAIQEEEQQFLSIVDRGLHRLNRYLEETRSQGGSQLSGAMAFDLHQTDGFLIELTEAMAARHGLTVNRAEFESCLETHHKESGKGAFADSVMAEGPLDAIRKQHGETSFLGYEQSSATAAVVGLIANRELITKLSAANSNDTVAVVLDQTPFYAESGGQVGDVGRLTSASAEFVVENTQKDGNLWLHLGRLTRGELTVGDRVEAVIDDELRAGIRRAHSATHIIHHALRQTLGPNALQRGSKVEADQLRFDFSHKQPVTAEEMRAIEDEVNRRVAEAGAVTTQLLPIEAARAQGAMALFGEKYPDLVRMVSIGEFSKELCGGTHLTNAGQVGFIKILGEDGIAKGVRRISALTGPKALARIRDLEQLVKELQQAMKVSRPDELPARIAALQEEVKTARDEIAKLTAQNIGGEIDAILAAGEQIGGALLIQHRVLTGGKDVLRNYVDQLREKSEQIAIVMGAEVEGRVMLIAAVSKSLLKQGLHAGNCVKLAAGIVGGGGGGRPDLAEAGGKDPARLDEALAAGANLFREALGGTAKS